MARRARQSRGGPKVDKWDRFLRRAGAATGLSVNELLDRLTGAGSTSVRVNPLHPDGSEAIRAEVLARLPALQPMPGDPDSFLCDAEAPAYELIPLADDGRVYLQNASSLLPVLALDPRPGERILDVAAAPGGKAFNIAGKTGNDGELWLNDAVKPRVEKLRALAERYHVRYEQLTMHKAQYLDKYLPEQRFDRILVDAQCTGEGRFDLRRRNALRYWSEERVNEYTHLQTKMIVAAAKLLEPGGTLVYSTCTISPEENEVAVHRALRRRPDLTVVPIDLALGDEVVLPGLTSWEGQRLDPDLAGTVRTLPGDQFEAFYVAKLVADA